MTAEDVLAELKAEREKYAKSDTDKMQALCQTLVDMGVYPAVSGIGYDPLKMVENWGVDWHEFRPPLECRHCGSDLCDRKSGPPFKREIGIIENDRCVAFMCPDCKKNVWMAPWR